MVINWYPGHMTKAKRMLQDSLRLVDVVVVLLDARAPAASANPELLDMTQGKKQIIILNKADLADPAVNAEWVRYYRERDIPACTLNSTRRSRQPEELIEGAARAMLEKYKAKGVQKAIRVLVAGIPNSGKSTFINMLSGSARARTGDRPGVTRGGQWIRVGSFLELLDTPGILWPRLEDQLLARHLAFTGAINDDVLDLEEVTLAFIAEMKERYPQALMERYGISTEGEPLEIFDQICRRRGWLLSGGCDYTRGSRILLDEFRAGKLGKISLERPYDDERTSRV